MCEVYIPFHIVRVHPESPLAQCLEKDRREIPSLFVGGPLDYCHHVEEHVLLQPGEERKGKMRGGRRRRKQSSWTKMIIKKDDKENSYSQQLYIKPIANYVFLIQRINLIG